MSQHRYRADVPEADRVTPPDVFFNRRQFMKAGAVAGILSPLAGGVHVKGEHQESQPAAGPGAPRRGPLDLPLQWPEGFAFERHESIGLPDDVDHALTERRIAATHNNYYEFLVGRGGPAWKFTEDFEVTPWKVEVSGECQKPATFDLDDLFGFEHQERLYHFRCVERWAMNVPWVGFPFRALLDRVEPTDHARFVRFLSVHRPDQMPGLAEAPAGYHFPYHEGLRMDEAMNELTMLATGIYGEPLPKQHGAPVRLVVPWKYGYKNPKSIVKIELVREQPRTFWGSYQQAHEYGFLSNVNPNIPHPRWSQARSYWVGTEAWFETPIFNGYEQYVAALYPDEPRTPQAPLHRGQIAR